MRIRVAGATVALGASILLCGCGAQNASVLPVPISVAPTSTPTLRPAVPAPTLAMPSGAAVVLDPTLLAVLPSTVGGVSVIQEPDSFGEGVKDPSFVASVDRAVFPIAVSANDPAAGGSFASGVVAHLRSGVYSDKMFADWRSSYDEGACAQSNGVLAHAQESLGGRTIYVTTCGGGLRVYHTYITSRDVIVSLLSVGQQDFGAQLMGGIGG